MSLFHCLGRWAKSLVWVGGMIGLCVAARAADERIVSVCNTTGLFASDLHITFTGTGGNVTVPPATVKAGFCPVPVVPSNGAVTNTVVIDWGGPCVPPGAWVTFVVRTTNGPLGFASGFWTLGGVNIGPVWPGCFGMTAPPPPPPPPPPTRGYWAWKTQTRCFPLGRVLKTGWMGLPGTPCWVRWECHPWTLYISRRVLCYFVNRRNRMVETGICRRASRWRISWFTPPKYFWRRTTIRPPDLNDPGDIPCAGPPNNAPNRWPGWRGPNFNFLDVAASDDSGLNWTQTGDMAASFFDVFAELQVTDPGTPPISGFSQTLQTLSPRFLAAAGKLQPLAQAIQSTIISEPDPLFSQWLSQVQQLQTSLQQMGADMADGVINSGAPYTTAQNALSSMGTTLVSITPSNQRFQNLREELSSAAQGMQVARTAFDNGLGAQTNQDYFLWGLQNRFMEQCEAIALASMPHVRVRLDIGQKCWPASELEGGHIYIADGATGEPLDHYVANVTERGMLYIPTLGIDAAQLRIGFKFDSFLGQQFFTPNTDGLTAPGITLRNGDVNSDGIINAIDQNLVAADLGQGGFGAAEVPPTDLNHDGIVDGLDMTILMGNLGQSENSFLTVRGRVHLMDLTPPGVPIEMVQMDLRGVRVESRDLALDIDEPVGQYTFPTFQSGLVRVWTKDDHWLAQATTQFLIGPGSTTGVDFILMNGDADGNNVIDSDDFDALVYGFGASTGSPNYAEPIDFNESGIIDSDDFDILVAGFGNAGDP